eukprot:TCONS_00048723-protein
MAKTMKGKRKKMTYAQSCQLRALVQYGKVKVPQILRNEGNRFPGFKGIPRSTMYRHSQIPLDGNEPFDKRKQNPGRTPLLNERDYRAVKRQIKILRTFEGSFSSKRLQLSLPEIQQKASNSTFRRHLGKIGYGYRSTRRKGILKQKDLKSRLDYAKRIKRLGLGLEFWKQGISFYLDAVGFIYKQNPLDQARAPTSREWRRRDEGLTFGCTAKGQKEGSTQIKFMVAISFQQGVVLCEQYENRLCGRKFSTMIRKKFPVAFMLSINPKSKRVLQDGCPVQNSRRAKRALEKLGAHLFCIPARSPDLNPIENFFHLVGKEIRKEAIDKQVTRETKEEFAMRVKNILLNYPKDKIDKIILSMDKRIEAVIANHGQRTKY